jgi:hypothetical protein
MTELLLIKCIESYVVFLVLWILVHWNQRKRTNLIIPWPRKSQRPNKQPTPGTPRANLHLARGPGATPRNLRLARRLDAPRVTLRIARGLDTPSGESPPRSRPLSPHGAAPGPPDWIIKRPFLSWAPKSRANPRRTSPLTPPGNQIPMLFDQPALCGHPWRCVGAVR